MSNEPRPPVVLLIGATGNVGPHVARAVIERGAAARVLTRNAQRAAGILPAGCALAGIR